MATEKLKNLKLGDDVVTSVPATIVESITNPSGDDTIVVAGTAANPTVAVQISSDSDNGLKVSHTAGSKGLYVNKESLGLSTAYVAKGSATVTELNTGDSTSSPATTWEDGWVYNLSDSGDLVNGIGGTSLHVDAGDNVVRITEGTGSSAKQCWDKLSSTVVIPTYTGSGVIDITNTTVSLNVKSGGGLDTTGDELSVKKADNSLAIDANGVKVNVKTNGGLNTDSTASTGGLEVKTGNGLEKDSSGVKVKAADNSIDVGSGGISLKKKTNGGLAVSSTSGAEGTYVDVDTTSVKIDASGKVAANLAASGGLEVNSGLKVTTGNGITLSSGAVTAVPNTAKGVAVTSSGIEVNPGTNVAFVSNAVEVDIDKTTAITDNTTVAQLITALGGTITT